MQFCTRNISEMMTASTIIIYNGYKKNVTSRSKETAVASGRLFRRKQKENKTNIQKRKKKKPY